MNLRHADGTTAGTNRTVTFSVHLPAIIETARGRTAPTRSYCPAESNESIGNLRDGDVFWLAGCEEGEGRLSFSEGDDPLAIFDVDVEPESLFDIEIVFVEGHQFRSDQMQLLETAARRWEEIIVQAPSGHGGNYRQWPWRSWEKDSDWWNGWWGDAHGNRRIEVTEDVPGLRVFATTMPGHESQPWASAGGFNYVIATQLPTLALLKVNVESASVEIETPAREGFLLSTMIHELGHALGFDEGTFRRLDLLGDSTEADCYFTGANAINAFNSSGGQQYSGHKVPLNDWGGSCDPSHWRESVLRNEVMTPFGWGREPLSLITIQSLADLGYHVDVTRADPFTIAPEAISKPVATARPFCEVLRLPAGVHPHGH